MRKKIDQEVKFERNSCVQHTISVQNTLTIGRGNEKKSYFGHPVLSMRINNISTKLALIEEKVEKNSSAHKLLHVSLNPVFRRFHSTHKGVISVKPSVPGYLLRGVTRH